jgi:hypothetical protein
MGQKESTDLNTEILIRTPKAVDKLKGRDCLKKNITLPMRNPP